MELWKAETLKSWNPSILYKPKTLQTCILGIVVQTWKFAPWHCNLGTLESSGTCYPRTEILELWNILKPLKPATLDSWSPVTLEPWNPATSESCNPGALESRNLRPFASLEPLCLSWAVVALRAGNPQALPEILHFGTRISWAPWSMDLGTRELGVLERCN